LLVADTSHPVRERDGVSVFFVVVVTRYLGVGFTGFGVSMSPAAFFGVLLSVEMAVAILTKVPVSKLAEHDGSNPSWDSGFLVYATFPILRRLRACRPVGARRTVRVLRAHSSPACLRTRRSSSGPPNATPGAASRKPTTSYGTPSSSRARRSAASLYGGDWTLLTSPPASVTAEKLAFGARDRGDRPRGRRLLRRVRSGV